jgi:hypothetical protein
MTSGGKQVLHAQHSNLKREADMKLCTGEDELVFHDVVEGRGVSVLVLTPRTT